MKKKYFDDPKSSTTAQHRPNKKKGKRKECATMFGQFSIIIKRKENQIH
jgi:hypothetical protein